MRVVFLGDSLTWGGYGGNFVDAIAERLPEHTIINAGVGGDTVVNLLRRLDGVLETHQPDALFVMVGGNDAVSYSMPATRGYYRKSKALEEGLVTPEQFEAAYRELLSQVQLAFVQPLVGLAPTEYSQELIEAKHHYNSITADIAEQMNIPVLDLDSKFTPRQGIDRAPVDLNFIQTIGDNVALGWQDYEMERAKWGYRFTFDGMHLMPQAASDFADQIVPFLKTHLV